MSEIHNADWLARQHNKKSDHVTGDWVTLHKAVKPIADALCPEGKATSEKPTNSPHWWVIYDGHFSAFENEIKNGDWEARDGNGVKSKSIDYTTMVKRSDVAAYCQPIGVSFTFAQVEQPAVTDTAPAEDAVITASEPKAQVPVMGKSTKLKRRNILTPLIELAQASCKNKTDTAEVWAALQPLAQQKKAPLIGATEDGLQYLKNGECKIFKRDSLRKRLSG